MIWRTINELFCEYHFTRSITRKSTVNELMACQFHMADHSNLRAMGFKDLMIFSRVCRSLDDAIKGE